MSTSARIKLPVKPKTSDDPSLQHAEPPLMRRKSTVSKRRVLIDSDEEGHRDKRPKTDEPEVDAEMEVDVDGIEETEEDTRFLPDVVDPKPPKGKGKNATGSHGGGGPKKKRQVVYSDAEDDNFQDSALQDGDFDFEPEKKSKSSARQKAKGKGGKGTGTVQGSKMRKGNLKEKDEKEIKMKDERKGPGAPFVARNPEPKRPQFKRIEKTEEPSTTTTAPAATDASSLFAENSAPLTPSTSSVLATSAKESTPPPPPPQKRKLPAIKKHKTAIQSGTSTPAQSQSQSQSQPATASQNPKVPTANRTGDGFSSDLSSLMGRKPPNTAAKVEVDLMNRNVYNQLFGSTGGTTPRSGLNRRERDEERRKELHRMRDEARAKREAEAKNTFNLQSQPDKIARFEEPLKHKTSAFWPNFLGARFLDEWERTIRRARITPVVEEDGEVR